MKRFVAVLILAGGLLVAMGALADITNVTGSTMYVPAGEPFDFTDNTAIVFQTGTSSTLIDSVSVALIAHPSVSAGSGTFTMELWNASSGVPTNVVASVSSLTGNYAPLPSGTVNTYSAGSLGAIATTSLSPNTQYAIVLKNASTQIYFGALVSNSYTVTDGWSYVGSLFNGSVLNSRYFVAAITAQALAPSAVPTLSEWAQFLLALMVFGIAWHFHNKGQNY